MFKPKGEPEKRKKSERRRRTTTGKISHDFFRQAVKGRLKMYQKRYKVLEGTRQELVNAGKMTRAESHDMNTYLGSIDGQIQFARMEIEEPNFDMGKVAKRLELVKRLSRLGIKLLQIAKNLPPKVWPVEKLGDKILEYPKIMRLTCELDFPETKVYIANRGGKEKVKADERWLSRLVLNLTANAMAAVERVDGKGGKVFVQTGVRGDRFTITVIDNGRGMTEEQKRKFLSGKRFTTKAVKKDHGLGFEVVKKTLAMHNAEIEIQDNKPKGTIFTVRLPLAK